MDASLLRVASRLALGGGVPEEAGEEGARGFRGVDTAGIIRILRENKVGLVSVAREREEAGDLLWRGIRSDPAVQSALAREQDLRKRLLDSYLEVSFALRSVGAEPVLFKSPAWFPYLSSNLDVLVPPRTFAAGASAISRIGHIRLAHYREDHKILFRTFVGESPALSVHLHEAVSWGKILVLDGDGVAARSVAGEDEGVRVASPGDALAATLAHTILETDEVRLNDLRMARWCLGRGASVDALLDQAREGRWLAAAASALAIYDAACRLAAGEPLLGSEDDRRVREIMARSPLERLLLGRAVRAFPAAPPFLLPRLHSKVRLARLILGDDRRDFDRRFFDLAASGWNLLANRARVRCRPASLITISGPDGAGKSRLAESLASTLALCEVPVKRVWSRGGFSSISVAGKAFARRLAPGAVPAPADEAGKRAFLRSGWKRAIWVWAVVLEQAAIFWRLRLLRVAGRTVICDRYVLDTLADLAARLPGGEDLPRGAAAFLLGAAPAPDIAFFIDVSPEVAHARKEDGGTADVRRDLAAAYRVLGADESFVRLDGDRPYEEMAGSAIGLALRCCFARFERGRS